MKNLFDFFDKNQPVIDFSLRATKRADGNFEFYIHPANVSGETMDFVVDSEGRLTEWKWFEIEQAEDKAGGQFVGGMLVDAGAYVAPEG